MGTADSTSSLRRYLPDDFVFAIAAFDRLSRSFNRGTRPVIPVKRFLSRQSSVATCSSEGERLAGVSTALRG